MVTQTQQWADKETQKELLSSIGMTEGSISGFVFESGFGGLRQIYFRR
jgi:hypothetical protein